VHLQHIGYPIANDPLYGPVPAQSAPDQIGAEQGSDPAQPSLRRLVSFQGGLFDEEDLGAAGVKDWLRERMDPSGSRWLPVADSPNHSSFTQVDIADGQPHEHLLETECLRCRLERWVPVPRLIPIWLHALRYELDPNGEWPRLRFQAYPPSWASVFGSVRL
jgi:hypothetical protein